MRPLLLIALALAACSRPSTPPPAEAAPAEAAPAEALPDTTAGQPVEADGALPFRTRLPGGVVLDQATSGEGERYAFRLDGHDALVLFVPASGAGFGDARAYAKMVAGDSAPITADAANGAFHWQADGRRNTLSAGEHVGRRYYLTESIPDDDAERGARLVSAVRAAWAWQPDGEPLR